MKDATMDAVVSQLDFAHNGLEYLIRVLRREHQRKDIVRAYIELTIKILESAEELLEDEVPKRVIQ